MPAGYSYLSQIIQSAKINSQHRPWKEIIFSVSQESIPGPISFNIFIIDLFILVDVYLTGYAERNSIYSSGENLEDLISAFQESFKKLFQRFFDNEMKGNSDKHHLIFSSNDSLNTQVGNSLTSYVALKLIGISLYANTSSVLLNNKLKALARVATFMTQEKERISTSFFKFLFENLNTFP